MALEAMDVLQFTLALAGNKSNQIQSDKDTPMSHRNIQMTNLYLKIITLILEQKTTADSGLLRRTQIATILIGIFLSSVIIPHRWS